MERFTANSDGTVIDNVTGLMWQQDDGKQRTWQESMDYAKNLTLGGHTDWRLPAIYELMGIIDYSKRSPAIDTVAFPNTNASYYWSSTTYANDPSPAWSADFGNGLVYYYGKTYYYYVRCVRDIGIGQERK